MALEWYILRRIFKYTSPLISIPEKYIVNSYSKVKSKFPTIYIIGPPRSGSTLFYQLFTNNFDVLYIDNFADLARKNLFFGLWLSQKKFKSKPHNCYSSKFGKTSMSEPHAPNEGQFWYSYFNNERHHLELDEYNIKKIAWIKKYHNAVKTHINKPLVIKNLSFSLRLELIHMIEPDAIIINITRKPEEIIYSIYKAREKLHWPKNNLWSIKPKNYKELEKLPVLEQITNQYSSIIHEIEAKKHLFGDRYHTIDYQHFCNNPEQVLNDFHDKIPFLNFKATEFPGLQASTDVPLAISKEIRKLLKKQVK